MDNHTHSDDDRCFREYVSMDVWMPVCVCVVGYFVHKEEGVFKVAEATQMALFLGQLHLVGMNTHTQTHTVFYSQGQVVG